MADAGRSPSSEPTFGYEGEEGVPVTQLPNWHEHSECVYADGRGVLTHGHGSPWHEPEPHTHLPIEAWGQAVPPSDAARSQS